MHPYEHRPDQAGSTPQPSDDPRTSAPWVSPGPTPGAPHRTHTTGAEPVSQPESRPMPPPAPPASGAPRDAGPSHQPVAPYPMGPIGPQGPIAPHAYAPHPVAHVAGPMPGGSQGMPPGAPPSWPIGSVDGPTAPRPRRRSWLPLVGTAAAAAILASAATVGFTGLADQSHVGDQVSLASLNSSGSTVVPVSGSSSSTPDWEAVAAAVRPSVVAIKVRINGGLAEGSGVVIDAKGHIITNNHVVSGAVNGGITVTLSDGRVYDATVVGTDPTTDLAVVALTNPPNDLVPATIGNSDKVKVGEPVMAVGNPLGLSSTATTGIVSALDRPVTTTDGGTPVVTNAIQIDAAINPGNSGGPLFNAQGEVVGITSSIASLSQSSGSIGLGFAIPSNLVDRIGAELLATGTAQHARLGVTLADGQATADGVTRTGAEIKSVVAGTPAAKSGLQVGDVIVAIDGEPVGGMDAAAATVRALAPGQSVTLTVVRGSKAFTVDVTLGTMPASTSTSGSQQGQSPVLPSLPWGQGG